MSHSHVYYSIPLLLGCQVIRNWRSLDVFHEPLGCFIITDLDEALSLQESMNTPLYHQRIALKSSPKSIFTFTFTLQYLISSLPNSMSSTSYNYQLNFCLVSQLLPSCDKNGASNWISIIASAAHFGFDEHYESVAFTVTDTSHPRQEAHEGSALLSSTSFE